MAGSNPSSKARGRLGFVLAGVLLVAGLLIVGIPGLWMYTKATAKILHPDPDDVPSVAADVAVGQKWASAAEQTGQIVRAGLAEQNLPGLSVAVGVNGEIVWAEAFGFADLDKQATMTPRHRFRIGSASVMLTSAAAGLLIEQGRLRLDEAIQQYVPAFPEKQWPVTLRQVMGHVSGIRNDGGDEGPLFSPQCKGPVEALPHFAERPLLFEPGTEFRYSSYGWILVSAAIEKAAGQPFLAVMRERVFEPLGMRDTVPEVEGQATGDLVTFYFPRFAADPKYGLHPMRELRFSCYSGASVFLSTPSDLVRFGMAMNNGKLLRKETVALLQTPQRLKSGKETGYGLGWDLEQVTLANGEQARFAGHDGRTLGGRIASLWTMPERGVVVAVTSNISYAETASLAQKIAQEFAAAAGH